MRCAIDRRSRGVPDLESYPNLADQLFISSLDGQTFNEAKFFSQLTFASLFFVIKIAKFSPKFVTLCEKEEYAPIWKKMYCILGSLLIEENTESNSFFTHSNEEVSHFMLLRGAYYFYRSHEARYSTARQFSDTELYWLHRAMRFESIHATQRYLQYLYQKVEQNGASDDVEKLLSEAITLSKTHLEQYGSYAYIMLAEAYFRYALWAQENENPTRARAAFNAALSACNKAETHLDASQNSIHNASLAKGLKASNTLGLEKPKDAIRFLKLWAIDNLRDTQPTMQLARPI